MVPNHAIAGQCAGQIKLNLGQPQLISMSTAGSYHPLPISNVFGQRSSSHEEHKGYVENYTHSSYLHPIDCVPGPAAPDAKERQKQS